MPKPIVACSGQLTRKVVVELRVRTNNNIQVMLDVFVYIYLNLNSNIFSERKRKRSFSFNDPDCAYYMMNPMSLEKKALHAFPEADHTII